MSPRVGWESESVDAFDLERKLCSGGRTKINVVLKDENTKHSSQNTSLQGNVKQLPIQNQLMSLGEGRQVIIKYRAGSDHGRRGERRVRRVDKVRSNMPMVDRSHVSRSLRTRGVESLTPTTLTIGKCNNCQDFASSEALLLHVTSHAKIPEGI